MRWINTLMEKADWPKAIIAVALLFAYSFWAFREGGTWMTALDAAGGKLPETQPGIPAIEPARSLGALGEATSDYIIWQALDIPYAVLSFAAASLAMALGLKALRLDKTALRFLLLLPAAYFICELIENTFAALFALRYLAPSEPFVLVQQLATTVKFGTGMPAMALGLLGLVIAAAASALRLLKGAKS